MRFLKATLPEPEWKQIFALVPHWCDDTGEMVWLEHIYRKLGVDWFGGFYFYRSARP